MHSQEESQGIVFAEAMAVGLPVVATKVGGVPYVVKNNTTGLLSEYGDVTSFANNIITLLDDRDVYDAFESAAKKEALNYTWQNIAKQVVQLYKEIR